MHFYYFALGKGNRRLIVFEEIYPMKKKLELRWVRGWDCGWTPYGLCFSPYWRGDIHDNFIIPFKDLRFSLYVDEIADPIEFGHRSPVLVTFSKKKDTLWEARIYKHTLYLNWLTCRVTVTKIHVRTEFVDLETQLEEAFHPNQARLKGNTR